MQPKSHTLFHFTKNLTFLKDILKNGFWPRYCLEDVNWYLEIGGQLAYPIVCFCDIPLSRVEEHIHFYGNYGIGVSRCWAKSNGLSPVLYLNEGSLLNSSIKKLLRENIIKKGFYDNSNSDMNTLLANIKPIEGVMKINGELTQKEFYQENEWRYSISGLDLKVNPWLHEQEFSNSKLLEEENNKSKEHYSLRISPSDIKYIFVKQDSDIPDMVNFIQSELDFYPSADIKILLSRIISLDTIKRDL